METGETSWEPPDNLEDPDTDVIDDEKSRMEDMQPWLKDKLLYASAEEWLDEYAVRMQKLQALDVLWLARHEEDEQHLGDAGRCREMQGDVGRCMEMQGDAGRGRAAPRSPAARLARSSPRRAPSPLPPPGQG